MPRKSLQEDRSNYRVHNDDTVPGLMPPRPRRNTLGTPTQSVSYNLNDNLSPCLPKRKLGVVCNGMFVQFVLI